MNSSTLNPAPASSQALARVKPFREDIRAALAAYRDANNLSLTKLSKELGIDASHVSKYLNRVPECDVERLEATIEDVLKSAATRRAEVTSLFESPASRAINSACELIRKTNDVGLIHAPAGVGKTSGIALYRATNASALVATLTKWSCGPGGIEAALYAQMETRGKKAGQRRAEWLVERLKDSNRLIILDNAHRLTRSALAWVFDFHDETSCPIGLVGNPELLETISENDQQFSRIGLVRSIKVTDQRSQAAQMLQRHAPEHADVLLDLAERVAGERGHLRALKKHLLLMPEFLRAAQGDARKAFLMAHTQVVSNYTLEN